MKNTDITKIRQLLNKANEGVGKLTPAGICYPLYKEKQIIKDLNKALALLLCPTCNGTGKIGGRGEFSANIDGVPNRSLKIPCPDCQPKPCKTCNGSGQKRLRGSYRGGSVYESCPDCKS